jgi:protein-S-isoprenylcysteine O-methyltransferase Ste14
MKRALASGLVFLQIALIAALVLLPHGTLWPVTGPVIAAAIVLTLAGATFAILGVTGLGPALTASPVPRKQAPLVTTGVYGLVRHPIYTGLVVGGLGLALFGASPWHVGMWLALVVLLSAKARWEERMLIAAHPDYRDYAARVGRFLPGVGRMARR